jgi:phosphoesterase RecJ-like protein
MKEDIIRRLDEAGSWLVIAHEKPDGDTIGCAAAMARLGLRLSKNTMLACPDKCPSKYSFLLKDIEFNALERLPGDFPGPGGVIICVDISTASRSFPELKAHDFESFVINIDHHADNELYGDINWIDPTASATGEMVTELLAASSWGIRTDEAEALYVAIVSDNGGFSFESTTLKSHNCAMALLEAGASPNRIASELDSNLSPEVLHLWGRAMARTTVFADGACAVYWLTKDDFDETGTSGESTENLVNFLTRIRGVRMSALCSEQSNANGTGIRVSIRARSPLNAREVARAFGGGGHDAASGCIIRASMPDAVSALKKEMERYVSRISADR